MQILKILMKALSRKKQQQNTITLFRESINVNNPIHFQTFLTYLLALSNHAGPNNNGKILFGSWSYIVLLGMLGIIGTRVQYNTGNVLCKFINVFKKIL